MIHAFSDDSVTDHLVVAGFAIFDQDRVAHAEEVLARAKAKVGVSIDEPFHCRVIFSGDARKRSAWAHLQAAPLYELVRSVALELKAIAERPLVCLADPKAAPAAPTTPDGPIRRPDVKEVASIVHGAGLSGLTSRYGHDGFKVWTDPDLTQIPWGAGRRRADSTRSSFVDLGPGIEPPQLVPIVDASPKPALVQVADLYAYTAARAHSPAAGRMTAWFRELYRTIAPERLIFEWNPDVKWEARDGSRAAR